MINYPFKQNNLIDKEEFTFCWERWIKAVVRPVSACLVIDVQNDFITGSLAISNYPAGHKGEEVRVFEFISAIYFGYWWFG